MSDELDAEIKRRTKLMAQAMEERKRLMKDWQDEHDFLKCQSLEKVKELVDAHRTFNIRTVDGETHLHMAVAAGDTKFIDVCLHAEINPNARAVNGETALHEAAKLGEVDVVSKLIEAGADVNACSEVGKTPLHVAAEFDVTPELINVLLDAGTDAKACDKADSTAWHYAQGKDVLKGTDAFWRLNDARFE